MAAWQETMWAKKLQKQYKNASCGLLIINYPTTLIPACEYTGVNERSVAHFNPCHAETKKACTCKHCKPRRDYSCKRNLIWVYNVYILQLDTKWRDPNTEMEKVQFRNSAWNGFRKMEAWILSCVNRAKTMYIPYQYLILLGYHLTWVTTKQQL